ncbi:hypothetical protein C1Y63_04860 [Corynebacterium sp. 13CS0277]|uniref:hypothetical protein n=1 Tax=Corynebacterium sp. 13CS0277 TaxID=2071994 RepID=UPI000D03FF19|nr:hypothetical protein [Corynebacterium sp. 13CS0277]PRQ11742.1 hypothetical protein C1Y63_04860 [Corynebacterium sp. 13CS0277]
MCDTPFIPTTEGRIWAEVHCNGEAQIFIDDGVLTDSVTMRVEDAEKFFTAGYEMFHSPQPGDTP